MDFWMCLSWYCVFVFLHDYVFMRVYCYFKKKKGNRKKCYFWTCKHWHSCPYNGE